MRRNYWFSLLVFLCGLFFAAASTTGQSTQGTILGTVRDTSGSVIASADIKITSIEEGASRTGASNELGDYLASNLKPGRYRIEVQKAGFKLGVTMTFSSWLARSFVRISSWWSAKSRKRSRL